MSAEFHQETSDIYAHCPICLETYKCPKALPCCHSFCESCIQSYIEKLLERKELGSRCDSFLCPVCKRRTPQPEKNQPPSEWAKYFPLNYALASVLEAERQDSRDPKKEFLCHTHPGKEIEYFCLGDERLCCSKCAIINHTDCDVKEIRELAKGIKMSSKLETMKQNIQKLRRHLQTDPRIVNHQERDSVLGKVEINLEAIGSVEAHFNSCLDAGSETEIYITAKQTEAFIKEANDVMSTIETHVQIEHVLTESKCSSSLTSGAMLSSDDGNWSEENNWSDNSDMDGESSIMLLRQRHFIIFNDTHSNRTLNIPREKLSCFWRALGYRNKQNPVNILREVNGMNVALVGDTRLCLLDQCFVYKSEIDVSAPVSSMTAYDRKLVISIPDRNEICFTDVKITSLKKRHCFVKSYPCFSLDVAKDCDGKVNLAGLFGRRNNYWVSLLDPHGVEQCIIPFHRGPSQKSISPRSLILDVSTIRVIEIDAEDDAIHCFYLTPSLLNDFTYKVPYRLMTPAAAAVDKQGHVYVIGRDSHNIHQISLAGELVATYGVHSSSYPSSITVHDNGSSWTIFVTGGRENSINSLTVLTVPFMY